MECRCQPLRDGALQEPEGADFDTLATRQGRQRCRQRVGKAVAGVRYFGGLEKDGEERPVQDRTLPEFWPKPKLLRP